MDKDLHEAPAIMFTNYKRTDGFEVSVTVRGNDVVDVAKKLDDTIELIKKAGGTPVTRSFGGNKFPAKEELPTKDCPVHHKPMKDPKGKGFYHSRGIYPDMEYCNGTGFPSDQ